MSAWVEIAVVSGMAAVGLGFFAIQCFLMLRDAKVWRRQRRDAEIEAKIDRKYRELQREVYSEIRREIRNELRYELRHEIRSEFEQMERRLGGRIDAAGQRRLETSGAARGLPEFGGRLSQRAIMTDSEWVVRLPASGPASD